MDETGKEDPVNKPAEEDFEALLEQGMGDPAVFDPGDKIEAVVTQVTQDWTFIDFGGKADGYIGTNEFMDGEAQITVREGDTLEAFFLPSPRHPMRFTTRLTMETAGSDALTDHLENAYQSSIPLDGVIEKEIKGGFAVKIGGNLRYVVRDGASGRSVQREADRPHPVLGPRGRRLDCYGICLRHAQRSGPGQAVRHS